MTETFGIGNAQASRPLASSAGTFRATDARRESLERAAQDFEAIFIRQLLDVMRRSVPEGDPSLNTPGSKLYESMMDDAMATQMARSGRGLGLADMLMAQLAGEEGKGGPEASD